MINDLPSKAEERGGEIFSARSFRSTLFCVLVLLVCIVSMHPVAEAGIIDDWAYIWSAKVFAQTGHVVYQGWGAMMLIWQLYLGALFIKLFGFSFAKVRVSMVLLSLFSAGLLHRILLRMGMEAWNAVLVTLCVVLSPLFLPVEASFMSDIPGLLAVLACWYCCLRALQAESDRAAVGWLIAAALLNDILGTARQISWLGVLVMVPSAAWCIRRRRGVPIAAVAVWVASLVFVAGCLHWFKHQPYVPYEPILFRYHRDHLRQLWVLIFGGLFLVSPMLVPFLLPSRQGLWSFSFGAFLLGGAAGCGSFLLDKGLSYDSNTLAISPFLTSFPVWAKVAIFGLSFAGLFCFAVELRRAVAGLDLRQMLSTERAGAFTGRSLLILLGPFTCAYMFLVVTRSVVWQRYLLDVLPVFLALIVWVYTQSRQQRRLPVVSALAVAVLGMLAVAETHDLFAFQAARASAVEEVEAAGVPRWAIEAGDQLDGWAQVEMTGYVNDYRLTVPAGAYRPPARTAASRACHGGFFDWTPSIHPRFQMSLSPSGCFPLSRFSPVAYRVWLPPFHRAIYILEVPEGQTSL